MISECVQVEEVWPLTESDDDDASPSEESPSTSVDKTTPIWKFLFFLFYWQSVFKVSNIAFTSLLCFLKYFFGVLGRAFTSTPLLDFSKHVPMTFKDALSRSGISCSEFIEYVVCPSCHSVYEFEDCYEHVAGELRTRYCHHVAYPNHPQQLHRQPCRAPLLKKVKSGKGHKLIPIKVFPYMPIRNSLQALVKRPGFLTACESWRNRRISALYLCDIYDGQIWRDFETSNFLSSPMSYLVTLNVDWFQPFLHTQYSVGAMYLTIQNLPRDIRCKEENVILVGVLPGPGEPKLAMNSYLSPLVEELKQGWKGFSVMTSEGVQVNIRVALSCIACDIPASRKVCGFVGHNASLACNKCLKKFPVQFGSSTNYSGYDRSTWTLRSCSMHRRHCEEILKETTKTGIRKMESKYGVRYSVLLTLPYFDPVRFSAIDTMHNLYLGTGKHAFRVWVSQNILTNENLVEIDRKARCFQVPAGVGRLPTNISSNYGGFKADQWKTWITVYSPILLKGILPNDHLQCWLLFVRACIILGQRTIKTTDISTADLLLLNYCKRFEELYGEDHCTMNLHLHLHLKDNMLDFGPSHAFWCFPFERCNGILGSYSTNMKAVEVQFMRKFMTSQSVKGLSMFVDEELCSLLPNDIVSHPVPALADSVAIKLLNMSNCSISSFSCMENIVELLPPLRECVFPAESLEQLENIYSQLYTGYNVSFLSPFYLRSNRILLAGDLIGSDNNAASATASSVIMAYWPGRGDDITMIDNSTMRVGVVQYYFRHRAEICKENERTTVNMDYAYILWKQQHPNQYWFGHSAIICFNTFEPSSPCNFIPVQRIAKKCAFGILMLEVMPNIRENLFVASPICIKSIL